MGSEWLGGLGLVGMMVLIFLGFPTAVTFFITGAVGIVMLTGWSGIAQILQTKTFITATTYEWTVMPLFVMMGIILFETKLGEGMFKAAQAWIGHLPGGLAASVSAACIAIGSMTGSAQAAIALMSKVAYPEMRKYHYQPDLALAVCAASGTAAILIPPSSMLVSYGILAQVNVGACLLAGFIPGILSMLTLMGMVFVRARFNPTLGPASPVASWTERFLSLRYLLPSVLMMVVIIGGLVFGVFTATEAAGMGAVGAFIIALALRRLTWKGLVNILEETTRLAVMTLIVIISNRLIGTFLDMSGLTSKISEIALSFGSPWISMAAVMVVLFILGMFMSGIMLYITVPMFTPMLQTLGFNLVLVAVIFIKMAQMGSISPPICTGTFIAQGIIEEVPMDRAYSGVWWFVVAEVINLLLILIFPQLSLWLPSIGQ